MSEDVQFSPDEGPIGELAALMDAPPVLLITITVNPETMDLMSYDADEQIPESAVPELLDTVSRYVKRVRDEAMWGGSSRDVEEEEEDDEEA